MSTTVSALRIPGVVRIEPPFATDPRGSFAKPYSAEQLRAQGVELSIREVFWSRSETGIVRGLHFQYPPAAVAKLVFVVGGRVRDVVLDLRTDSPTAGQHEVVELDEAAGGLLVPVGCAHGFEVVDGPAVMCYLQDGPFDPSADAGVRWDSAGVDWQTREPMLSERDRALPPLRALEPLSESDWASRA